MKLERCSFSDYKELAAGIGPKIVFLCSFSQEGDISDENRSMEWHKGFFHASPNPEISISWSSGAPAVVVSLALKDNLVRQSAHLYEMDNLNSPSPTASVQCSDTCGSGVDISVYYMLTPKAFSDIGGRDLAGQKGDPFSHQGRQEDASSSNRHTQPFGTRFPRPRLFPRIPPHRFIFSPPLFLASSDSLLNDSVRDGNVKRSSGPLLGFFCATTKLMFGLDFGRSLILLEEVRVRILPLDFGRSLSHAFKFPDRLFFSR
ncbi:hypothetical protein L1887_05827 [Cichorium endivia]|nr:hypothetical protein L1887_05827 [Cichorium endivia]